MTKPVLALPAAGLWAIEPTAGNRLAAASIDATSIAARVPLNWQPTLPLSKGGGVAVVDIMGPLERRASLFSVMFDGGSHELIARAVEMAAADPEVRAIVLRIDSPGGACDGIAEAGDAIYRARQRKKIIAAIDGMAASAGYYLASQAHEIFAGRMDLTGSIGTRMTLYDFSGMFEKAGIRAVSIDTGAFKSAGARGLAISDEQVAYFRGIIDNYFADFKAAVLRGRGRMTAKALDAVADGRVFVASEAVTLGLVDAIRPYDEVLRQAIQSTKPQTMKGTVSMSNTAETLAAAVASEPAGAPVVLPSIGELKAACPGASADFLLSQLEAGATCEQAAAAWNAGAAKPTAELLKAAFPTASAGSVAEMLKCATMAAAQTWWAEGQKALEYAKAHAPKALQIEDRVTGSNEGRRGSALRVFQREVAKLVKEGKSRGEALATVARTQSSLHRAMLQEANANNPIAQEWLSDRFARSNDPSKPAQQALSARIEEIMADTGCTRAQAVGEIYVEEPGLIAEATVEANRGRDVDEPHLKALLHRFGG